MQFLMRQSPPCQSRVGGLMSNKAKSPINCWVYIIEFIGLLHLLKLSYPHIDNDLTFAGFRVGLADDDRVDELLHDGNGEAVYVGIFF